MEIIIAIVLVGLFVFMLTFLIHIFVKKDKPKTESKNEAKPQEKPKTTETKPQEKKDDIPEILKEVTQGNYMYDIAHEEKDDVTVDDMDENQNISQDDITEESVDEAYHKIEAIEDDYDDDKLLDTSSIIDDIDGKNDQPNEDVEEFKRVSRKTKALLISDILKRKGK